MQERGDNSHIRSECEKKCAGRQTLPLHLHENRKEVFMKSRLVLLTGNWKTVCHEIFKSFFVFEATILFIGVFNESIRRIDYRGLNS